MNIASTSSPSLYLIRHGETAWSVSGQHTGLTDIPLTALGEAEARAIGPRLELIDFSHVMVSPLTRAHQTYELSGLGGDRALIVHDLVEWDYGDYEGQRSSEIRAAQPGWNIFRDGCPRGETPQQISGRADRVIADAVKRNGPIAMFTHGQFAMALAVRWIGLPIIIGQHLALETASVSVLTINPIRPDIRMISSWNTIAGR